MLAPEGIQFRDNDRTVQLTFPTLEVGTYQFVIDEASITDRPGNPLGSGNVTSSSRSCTVLQSSAVWINPNGGNWSNPANWASGAVPGLGDNVLIDVTDSQGNFPTIIYDSGTTEINSLLSLNPLLSDRRQSPGRCHARGGQHLHAGRRHAPNSRVVQGTDSQAIEVQSTQRLPSTTSTLTGTSTCPGGRRRSARDRRMA